MSVEFSNSETMRNLMRAFAGESQARNRYTFAASQAKKSGLYVIEQMFVLTAEQERQHAAAFYNQLRELSGQTIHIDGGYPVDISPDMPTLLEMAKHNEYEEHEDVYKRFGEIAREEGFQKTAGLFQMIGNVEKIHGDRFGEFSRLIQENQLFVSNVETKWMCLKCGFTVDSKEAPMKCPVCEHEQGYFVRVELAPYTGVVNFN